MRSLLFILIIAAVFAYDFLFATFFQIKQIDVSGNKNVSSSDITKIVTESIYRRIASVSTKSIFLFRQGETKRTLLAAFPKLASVSLRRELPDKISILVSEREPRALWCETVQDNKDRCMILDGEGIAFESADASSDAGLLLRRSGEGPQAQIGKEVLSKEKLSQILTLRDEFKTRGFEIKEALLLGDARIDFKTAEGWELYFSYPVDIPWQTTRLKLILEKQIPAEKRQKLEYIDLRFGKVYYKYRD